MQVFEREFNKPTGLILNWTTLNPPKKKMKIIYEPKEFIIDKELNEQENEIKFGRYLDKYYNKKQINMKKLEELNKKTKLKHEGDYTSSSKGGYTLSNDDISYSKSEGMSSISKRKKGFEEEEKKEKGKKEKKNIEISWKMHIKKKNKFILIKYINLY